MFVDRESTAEGEVATYDREPSLTQKLRICRLVAKKSGHGAGCTVDGTTRRACRDSGDEWAQ